MTEENSIHDEEIEKIYLKTKKEAEQNGYYLNDDLFFSKELIKSLLINQERYGYQACPCRLASGDKEKDMDIICPCDYRDADLNDYGACYCALYVTGEVLKGKRELSPVPERRQLIKDVKNKSKQGNNLDNIGHGLSDLKYPVWRCRVCGYLCSRENPPGICPICKAKKDRFEKFL